MINGARNQVFACPLRYTQGPDATKVLGAEIAGLGLRGPVFVLAGRAATAALAQTWSETFAAAGMAFTTHAFGGECSRAEIARGRAAAAAFGARVIVAAGGGKALDAGRAIADELGLPAVCCPTIASTDAPCSALSVIYTEGGVVEAIQQYHHNPELVLVDSAVIMRAPLRLLIAGMGDALSTWFEARACFRSGAPNVRGGRATRTAMAIAECCWRSLQDDGLAAIAAMKSSAAVPPPELERIIETNTLISGLGFESAGLAGAHAIHNGITVAEGSHAYFHGEKVAFGTLAQLVLEQAPKAELDGVLDFCVSTGLPVTLGQIGLAGASDELISRIAHRAVIPGESIHHEPFAVTAAAVAEAIRGADAFGRARLAARA